MKRQLQPSPRNKVLPPKVPKTQFTGEIISGQATVDTPGKNVLIGTHIFMEWFTLVANSGNSGDIYLGGQSVSSASGLVFPPGAYLTLYEVWLDSFSVDAETASDGVSWIGGK